MDLKIYQEMLKYQDFRVQSNENNDWTPRRILTSIKDLEAIRYRHRTIFIHEVVFDADCPVREISTPVSDRISWNLQRECITHQVWDTSRSPHIHCFFEDMNLYTKDVRRMIRLIIMKHYAQGDFKWLDKGMANEDRNIRDFNSLHEDTRKPKTLVYEYTNKTLLNPIPLCILDKLKVLYNTQENMPLMPCNKPTEAHIKEMQEFITFCTENTLRADGKKTILSRNVAIACLLLGYDSNARHRIYHKVNQNSTSKILNSLVGWDRWLGKKSNLYFNWREIKRWYVKQQDNVQNLQGIAH